MDAQPIALCGCKAVFLDRDGTLNVNHGYVHNRNEWGWISGAISSLKALQDAGFALVVVTNQAGIARGYYQYEDVKALHEWMQSQLSEYGIHLAGIYICPHHPDFGSMRECRCRKPQSGMLIDAARDLQLDLVNSWIIGDQVTDALAGLNVGTKAIVVSTSSIEERLQSLPLLQRKSLISSRLIEVVPTIEAAVALILAA